MDYTGENPQVTTDYTANELNQYTYVDEESLPDYSPTYDDDGNMTQDDEFDYTWDAENRLTSVTPRNPLGGSMKSVFAYDYMGRRVRKQIYMYSGGQWNSTPTIDRKFIYDGWNLLLELNALSSDAVLEKYTWGLDLSGQSRNARGRDRQGGIAGLHKAGGIGGLLSMRDVGTTTSLLYMYSANGDVGQLVKVSDGSFGAKHQYYPYGGEIGAVGTYASTNPFRFSTKYWDAEHQAYYYGRRYHKPKLGRWLSRDPLQEKGGINLYEHTRNSPIGRFDALGLRPRDWWDRTNNYRWGRIIVIDGESFIELEQEWFHFEDSPMTGASNNASYMLAGAGIAVCFISGPFGIMLGILCGVGGVTCSVGANDFPPVLIGTGWFVVGCYQVGDGGGPPWQPPGPPPPPDDPPPDQPPPYEPPDDSVHGEVAAEDFEPYM